MSLFKHFSILTLKVAGGTPLAQKVGENADSSIIQADWMKVLKHIVKD